MTDTKWLKEKAEKCIASLKSRPSLTIEQHGMLNVLQAVSSFVDEVEWVLEDWMQEMENTSNTVIKNHNVTKGLEWILEDNKFGFGEGLMPSENAEEQAGYYIRIDFDV